MSRRLVALVIATGTALTAHAHGEEVLVSFYAQAITVTVVLLSLRFVPGLRLHWVAGVAGCIAGVVASWLVTADLPYMQNQLIITAVAVITPPVVAALSVYVARRYTSI